MNHTIRLTIVAVVACAIGSFATYRIAYHRGFERGYWNGVDMALGEGAYIRSAGALGILQHLRAGEVPRATRELESACLDSAHIFFEKPPALGEAHQWTGRVLWYPGPSEAKALARGLSQYRAMYRTNSADWDAMERKLGVELTKVK
jgi:hypothetical protein